MKKSEEETITAIKNLFAKVETLRQINIRDILKPDVYFHYEHTLQEAYDALTILEDALTAIGMKLEYEHFRLGGALDELKPLMILPQSNTTIELVVNISNQLENDALIMLNWHTKDHGLAVGENRFPDEAKSLMQVLGEYPAQRWSVTNGRSFSGVQHEEPTRE